jgi:predicted kinase
MKEIHILRGPSGSGKSTFASKLTIHEEDHVVCSADKYFLDHLGEYKFNPAKLGVAHAECLETFLIAIKQGVPLIIVDNTHTQEWEWINYARIGEMQEGEYKVTVHNFVVRDIATMNLCAARNAHAVPKDVVYRMCGEFEEHPGMPAGYTVETHEVACPTLNVSPGGNHG